MKMKTIHSGLHDVQTKKSPQMEARPFPKWRWSRNEIFSHFTGKRMNWWSYNSLGLFMSGLYSLKSNMKIQWSTCLCAFDFVIFL